MWLPAGTNQHRDRFISFRERKSAELGRELSVSATAALATGLGLDYDERIFAGRLTLRTINNEIDSYDDRWFPTTIFTKSETIGRPITAFFDPLPTAVEINNHRADLARKEEGPVACRVTSRFMSDGSVNWWVDILGG